MDGAAATGVSSSQGRHIEVGPMDGGAATGGSSSHGHAEASPMGWCSCGG